MVSGELGVGSAIIARPPSNISDSDCPGFLLALPLMARSAVSRNTRSGLRGVGVLYTIPSLALFMLLPPLLGISVLSEANVIIALTIYAVAIMVRTVADAFASIEPHTLRSATAMGYAEWGRFFSVELPLRAGLARGASGRGREHGEPCHGRSLSGNSVAWLSLYGRVPAQNSSRSIHRRGDDLLIALLVDALLVLIGRLVLPWSHLAKKPVEAGA